MNPSFPRIVLSEDFRNQPSLYVSAQFGDGLKGIDPSRLRTLKKRNEGIR